MLLVLYLVYKTTAIVIYTQVRSFCNYLISCTIMGVSTANTISSTQDNGDCDLYTVSSFCSYLISCTIMRVSAASTISCIQDNGDCDLYTFIISYLVHHRNECC